MYTKSCCCPKRVCFEESHRAALKTRHVLFPLDKRRVSVVGQTGGKFFFKGFTSVLHLTQRVKFSDKERLYLSVRSVVKNAHFTPVALYYILYYNNYKEGVDECTNEL